MLAACGVLEPRPTKKIEDEDHYEDEHPADHSPRETIRPNNAKP
jgi:hypothetical protein